MQARLNLIVLSHMCGNCMCAGGQGVTNGGSVAGGKNASGARAIDGASASQAACDDCVGSDAACRCGEADMSPKLQCHKK